MGLRTIKSVFVGYDENLKAYRLLDIDTNVIVESRDVEFLKASFLDDSTNPHILNYHKIVILILILLQLVYKVDKPPNELGKVKELEKRSI